MNSESARRHLRALPDVGPVPDSVRTEIERAAELWQTLHDQGKQLRYEVDELTGRVSAELCDLDGARLRAVPLPEALGASDEDSPAA